MCIILLCECPFKEASKFHAVIKYVTGPEKTGLIYTKYTYSYTMVHISFSVYAIQFL